MSLDHPDKFAAEPPGIRVSSPSSATSILKDDFDIPIMLSLAFWTSLFGILLERSQILLTMLKVGRPFTNLFSYFIYSLGSFLLNFSILISITLIIYYLIKNIKAGGGFGRVVNIIAALFALTAVLTALSGLIFQTTVIIFLSSQLLTLAATSFLLIVALVASKGRIKMILTILPVLSFLFQQINQIHFFFPHLIPSPLSMNVPAIFLLTGQLVFFLFAALTAVATAKWNKRNKLPLFIPFLIALSILFISIVSIIGSEKARMNFFSIIEVQYILPYSYYIYPLVFSLIVFAFALLLVSYPKDFKKQILRLRSGYAIGFIILGTFTPATCYEIIFLLLGMILWLQTIPQWKDL